MSQLRTIRPMRPIPIIAALMLSLFSLNLAAQEFGERVTLTKHYSHDLYAAGGMVMSTASIDGDLVAAGGSLIIDGHITGDALLSGGDTTITAEIADDLRAMGGTLVVNSKIGGDAILAGGQIVLSQGSEIGGNAWLGGGQVTVAARIHKELRVGAGHIALSGHITGDALIWGETITIDDGAVIEGDLTYHSPNEAIIHPNAQIHGTVIYNRTEFDHHSWAPSLFTLITLAITAILFYLLFPAFSVRSNELIGQQFWKSLGVGTAALLVIPFIAIFMMSIVIGVWIGLVLIALYLVGMLLGSLLGMLFIGSRIIGLMGWDPEQKTKQIGALLLAYALVGVLQLIPLAGGLLTCLIMVVGIGAGLLSIRRIYLASK